jgi:hypothetical protein
MKKFIKSSLLSLFLLLTSITPAHAQTTKWTGVCVGNSTGFGTDEYNQAYDVATIQGLQCLIANVLSVAITIIGLTGFVMILYGSFKYLISGGNSKHTDSARATITYAIIGLVVALSSIIVLNLISAFTGINDITKFVIPYFE